MISLLVNMIVPFRESLPDEDMAMEPFPAGQGVSNSTADNQEHFGIWMDVWG